MKTIRTQRGSRAGAPAAARRAAGAIAPALLSRMYRNVLLLRILDEKMLGLQRQGRIGFFGTVTGEEAAVIGSAAALDDGDWVFPALRQGGVLLWRGAPVDLLVAQCVGNGADPIKGRQMPSHYSDRRWNVVSWSSCIGNQLPQAVGAAYAARLRGDATVVVGYMGDGATSSADFHAALNFAGVWRAPVVFVCQNNQWAISVPRAAQTAAASIAVKAKAYGFEGIQVDGNDCVAVYEATRAAVEKARAGGGPTLLEVVTYRLGGHSSSDDPTKYRDPEEVERWRARDPIPRLRARLSAEIGWSDADDARLREELKAQIDAAVRRVEAAPPLDPDTLFDDVYRVVPPALLAQRDALRAERTGRTEEASGDGAFPL